MEVVQVTKVYPAKIERRPDVYGGTSIFYVTDIEGQVSEFCAVQIYYDYCYMDNSRREWLSSMIEKVLKGEAHFVETGGLPRA